MQIDDDFQKAVNGWKQAVSIIRRLKPSLDFALAEVTRINTEQSSEKAAKYQEAVYAADQAEAYLNAMDRAVT